MGEGFLNEKFSKILIDWLSDRIYGVREAAIRCIRGLIDTLGSQWAEKQLFPKIIPFQSNPNYLHRMTLLFIIQQVGTLLSPATLSKTITPILIPMSKDPVANVRMNAAKALKIVIPRITDKSGEICKKALVQLTEDSDPDVKHEAKNFS
jgi:serine/threonine-protein phosphatase 2A regulatory subunit A